MLNCISLHQFRHAASLSVKKAKLPHWFQKLVWALCSLGSPGINQRIVIWKTHSLGMDSCGAPPECKSLAWGWIFFVKIKAVYYATWYQCPYNIISRTAIQKVWGWAQCRTYYQHSINHSTIKLLWTPLGPRLRGWTTYEWLHLLVSADRMKTPLGRGLWKGPLPSHLGLKGWLPLQYSVVMPCMVPRKNYSQVLTTW
jgi:hypothetical protein